MSTITANPLAKSEPRRLDRLGIMLSSACAVHCIVTPFVIGTLVYAGADWVASETTELLLIGSAFLIALASLVPSYLKHRNPVALFIFALGIALIVGSHLTMEGHGLALGVFMALGGCCIAFAHYRNHRLCACCGRG